MLMKREFSSTVPTTTLPLAHITQYEANYNTTVLCLMHEKLRVANFLISGCIRYIYMALEQLSTDTTEIKTHLEICDLLGYYAV